MRHETLKLVYAAVIGELNSNRMKETKIPEYRKMIEKYCGALAELNMELRIREHRMSLDSEFCLDCYHYPVCDVNRRARKAKAWNDLAGFYEKEAESCDFYEPTSEIVKLLKSHV